METIQFGISIAVAIAAGISPVIIAAWRISGQISNLGGQISALSARMDGMERHLTARIDGIESRLSKLETEVHAINDYLRSSAR